METRIIFSPTDQFVIVCCRCDSRCRIKDVRTVSDNVSMDQCLRVTIIDAHCPECGDMPGARKMYWDGRGVWGLDLAQ